MLLVFISYYILISSYHRLKITKKSSYPFGFVETAIRNCRLLWSYYVVCLSEAINKAAEAWGVDCKRYEIRELTKFN